MTETEQRLRAEFGNNGLLEHGIGNVRPLLDDEGVEAYLKVVEMFMPFDDSVSVWLLRSGGEMLCTVADSRARREALDIIPGFGRSNWSAAAEALKQLSQVGAMGNGFVLKWLGHGRDLAAIDMDAAIMYFRSSPQVVESIGTEAFDKWAQLGKELARKSWKAAKAFFGSSPEVVKKIEQPDIEKWVRLGIYLIDKSPNIKAAYDAHSMLAAGSHAGKDKKLELVVQYFRSAPQILGRLSINDLEKWVTKGLETVNAQEDKDKGTSFFSLQTGKSRSAVEGLVKGLELMDIHIVLRTYAEALTGKTLLLRSSSMFYKNLPGLSRFLSVTDGKRIYLPSSISVFDEEDLNFKAYKLALAHEMSHIEYGTFELGPEDVKPLSGPGSPVAAFRIFEFLEDERVDYLMGRDYPGLLKDKLSIMAVYMGLEDTDTARMSVFESIGLRSMLGEASGIEAAKGRLADLLREALPYVRDTKRTAQEVLALTMKICATLGDGADDGADSGADASERLFYRGAIDFQLIEEAAIGMRELLVYMMERLEDKKALCSPELVEEALARLEEIEGIEPDELLWQITDPEQMDDLFERLQQAISDIEDEKRFRRSVQYDEWDHGLCDYKKEWCRVREIDMPATSTLFYETTIRENYGVLSQLRRYFGLLRPDRVMRFFREERGDEIDYNALIESIVERKAGVSSSDRVYVRREKNLRDVSVAFLADMSYSTSDVLPSGKTIIDVEKEGLVMMAEALESIGDQWAVYGFSTNRRECADFYVVKDFDMSFSEEVKMRFENIRPMAQTRLGAVIRHATALLAYRPSKVRLLVLLSDGRPYDLDYGDAQYAVEDTRRAIWEGRKKGITFYCITVDKKSRDYLPYMYGESNYTLIEHVEALPAMLPLIYKRLTS